MSSSVFPSKWTDRCPDIHNYEKFQKIGEGAYGQVFKAEHKRTKRIIAAKKLLHLDQPRIALAAVKEMTILRKLKHENIINLIEICHSKGQKELELFLTFPLCSHDLFGLIKSNQVFLSLSVIIDAMQQLLCGVSYMHENSIMHRDLKPSNIFVTKSGVIKIGDLGLSCEYQLNATYSNNVVTLYYRSPELLLGNCVYTPLIDIWSLGCIFSELFTRRILFATPTPQQQLKKISYICGSICSDVWPEVVSCQLFNELVLPKGETRKLREVVKIGCTFGQDLLDKFLTINPKNRIDAKSALEHEFFKINPIKTRLRDVLKSIEFSFIGMKTMKEVCITSHGNDSKPVRNKRNYAEIEKENNLDLAKHQQPAKKICRCDEIKSVKEKTKNKSQAKRVRKNATRASKKRKYHFSKTI